MARPEFNLLEAQRRGFPKLTRTGLEPTLAAG
jgi:hypothetical protein